MLDHKNSHEHDHHNNNHKVIDEIRHAINHIQDVCDVTEVRVRWLGHRLHAEVNLTVNPELSIDQGHEIAKNVRHQLLHHLQLIKGYE